MHLQKRVSRVRFRVMLNAFFVLAVLIALVAGYTISQRALSASPALPASVNQAFSQASSTYGVPAALLKAICYTEGRMSNNGGQASEDNGFGCMHLVKNTTIDTLDKAAKETGLSVKQLKQNMVANILGGAAILRDDALQASGTQGLPGNLADWYGAIALYSDAPDHSIALIYANNMYKLLDKGFSITADDGELVTLAAQRVQPDTATANTGAFRASASLPSGCKNDGNVDYPGAIDCVLTPPTTFDCNNANSPSDCNYTSSDRPTSCTVNYPSVVVTQPCNIDQIVIHDTEGSLASALSVFQCPAHSTGCEQSSAHYIIDTDGTVYQVLREHDIAYHDGNFWSNMHSIGIEHVGFDATGYNWYNSAQYLASAKLVAYLLKKYNLPLDRTHIVAHGTVPAGTLAASPNHVDPGPYWLWDYYFNLISQQGVVYNSATPPNTITLRPKTDQTLEGPNGTETSAQYNFFKLYKGPSTSSGIIPTPDSSDAIDTGYNVEPGMSYYFLKKAQDSAGTGDTMYEIWYGEEDQTPNSYFADAKLAWLAVPAGDGVEGQGTRVSFYSHPNIALKSSGSSSPQIYSRPVTSSTYVIGGAPAGAIFTTGYTVTEDNTNNLWYEINFNHRQAWVPASEVSLAIAPKPLP
jgi:N-acetyl-anhydromuramyl-L-alanine amidase AmpD